MIRRAVQATYRRLAVRGNVALGSSVHIGPGSRVWAPTDLSIGDGTYIGKWCSIEVDGKIGRGSLIANNVGIIGRTDHDMRQLGRYIADATWCGEPAGARIRRRIDIGDDVWIGFGAILLAPVTVQRGAVVAAGAVVIDDVPAYHIVGGNPARIIGKRFSDDEIRIHEGELGGAVR